MLHGKGQEGAPGLIRDTAFRPVLKKKKADLFWEDAIFREFLASGGGCGISSALEKRKNLHAADKDGCI